MRFLHTMVRVLDLDAALFFYVDLLGLRVLRRTDHERGRFSLVFLSTGRDDDTAAIELTWNWDQAEPYGGGRNMGHLAFAVDDIYSLCEKLQENGVPILRPPRDGRMAFVKSPDGISIELLQDGAPLPPRDPWQGMPSTGSW
ncbi:MAG: VOC family protein [Myxococcota bacterium]|nr:VOC family protein [Myxococcota bacterium]